MRTKICTGVCGKRLPADEIHFAFRRKDTGALRQECKDCYNAKKKKKFILHKSVRAAAAASQTKARQRNRSFVIDYLREHPCMDCGETDGVVLEFDHVRGEKFMGISPMIWARKTIEALTEEIAKCDVVCANCHRRRTASRAGWDAHYK